MSYKYYNPNKNGRNTGDCVVRAISKVINQSWDDTYWDLCEEGYILGDWGDSNIVWDSYLRKCGFVRRIIPNTCPECYTVREFCYEHSYGVFVLATGSHVIAVMDGDYYDSWDSGNV